MLLTGEFAEFNLTVSRLPVIGTGDNEINLGASLPAKVTTCALSINNKISINRFIAIGKNILIFLKIHEFVSPDLAELFIFERNQPYMHYIQNSWFTYNWIWIVFLMLGAATLIAYIKNRQGMMRKSLFLFAGLLLISLSISLLAPDYSLFSFAKPDLAELSHSDQNMDGNNTIFSKILELIARILKEKLN
jgi:hypothetical protein